MLNSDHEQYSDDDSTGAMGKSVLDLQLSLGHLEAHGDDMLSDASDGELDVDHRGRHYLRQEKTKGAALGALSGVSMSSSTNPLTLSTLLKNGVTPAQSISSQSISGMSMFGGGSVGGSLDLDDVNLGSSVESLGPGKHSEPAVGNSLDKFALHTLPKTNPRTDLYS